ncbi:MAG: hypothetical protein ABIY62_09605 [Ginsengibacter sp.]
MKILLFFLCFFFTIKLAFSQVTATDSLAEVQVKNVVQLYKNYTDGNAPVYNGAEYIYYIFQMRGNPFFNLGDSSDNWVSYANEIYQPLAILYDIQRNQVVVLLPDSVSRIVLHNELVDSFGILNHTFIKLEENHNQNLYTSGFYEILHSGHVQLLSRRTKTLQDLIETNSAISVFLEKDRYYIHKNNLYYMVDNQKDVFSVFSDKRHDLKKFLRKQHLKMRGKNFEGALIQATAWYDKHNSSL